MNKKLARSQGRIKGFKGGGVKIFYTLKTLGERSIELGRVD